MASLVITVETATILDIVMSANTTSRTALGITAYGEPAIVEINEYSPGSPYLNWGGTALSFSRQKSLLSFTVAPFLAADESAADVLIESLRAALSRLDYQTTVVRNGVTKTWLCDAGSVTPANARSRIDLERPWITEWNVSIPCSLVS